MKPGIPWSVKGIDQEAREAAKDAARRSGMTLGEWLNSMILESAGGTDDLDRRYSNKLRERPAAEAVAGYDPVRGRLDQLAQQLTALAEAEAPSAGAGPQSGAAPDEEALLNKLMERIEAKGHQASRWGIEPRSGPAHAAALPGRRAEQADASAAAVALALRHVAERIEVSESRTCAAIRALETRLPGLAGQVRESQAPHRDARGQDQIEAELARIARDIEALRQGGSEAAEAIKSAALDAARDEVRHAEGRLEGLIAEVQRTTCSSTDLADALSRFRPELNGLKQRLDEHLSETTSDREIVAAVERHVGRLGDRVAAIEQRLGDLAALEGSLAELTRRLDEAQSATRSAGQSPANAADVAAELKALEEGLEAVRESAALADERTKEALEAVHRALDQILGKLRDLEAGNRRRVPDGSMAWGSALPRPRHGADSFEDFIAAARRAAQPEALGVPNPSRLEAPAGGRRWSLFRRMRGAAASGAGASDGGRRNRLLLAALVLLAALAAAPGHRLPEADAVAQPAAAPMAEIRPVNIMPKAAPRGLARQAEVSGLGADQTNSW